MNRLRVHRYGLGLLGVLLLGPALMAEGERCEAVSGASGPDVILGDIDGVRRWGTVGEMTSYSIGTHSCNVGDEILYWKAWNSEHPVIGQNMFRLQDGRFEQVGMSWLKHGFAALALNLCGNCQPTPEPALGIGCSDPYDVFLNGSQSGLGPRSEVNPATGGFPFPYEGQGQTGDAVFKRLQVRSDDVDPGLNPGARYFVEGHYIHYQDAASQNDDNNASYREISIDSDLSPVFIGPTQVAQSGIRAWATADPEVELTDVQIPDDGLVTLGAKVEELGDGTWRYEYALYNMNSHRAVGSVGVPIAAGVQLSNVGFHDVDYHSGEPYDGTDWATVVPDVSGGTLSWETVPHDTDPNANALRWGTLYNYRFDADAPPRRSEVTLGLFRPGAPDSIGAGAPVPCVIDGNYELTLDVGPIVRSDVATFEVTGAESGELVRFAYSTGGEGCGPCLSKLGGSCLDILDPFRVFGQATAGPDGRATLDVTVPPGLPFDSLAFQAVVLRGPGGTTAARTNPVTSLVVDP